MQKFLNSANRIVPKTERLVAQKLFMYREKIVPPLNNSAHYNI